MTTSGFLLARNMSTTNGNGDGEEKMECMADMSDVVADKTMEAVSFGAFPLNGMSPTDVAEGKEQMKRIYKEHGVSYFTPFKGPLIQGPIFVSFFLAIQKMVEKVPSLETGGISWFIDLTSVDSFYILPFLAGFSFWVTVESNMREAFKGDDPAAVIMKNVSRGLSALTVPLAATFPNKPSVKKLLNITVIETNPAFSGALQPRQGETKPTITDQRNFVITSQSEPNVQRTQV
ncbi:hypothetical protein L2E82_50746 [Cichorium intybus]|nr:hypothetical protein L2E82_50746 [Cichorium intybus]